MTSVIMKISTAIANLLISKPNVFMANDTRVLSGQFIVQGTVNDRVAMIRSGTARL